MNFLFWKALLAFAAFDIFRFRHNFTRMHRFVKGWPLADLIPQAHVIESVCRAINIACAIYPKRVMCLQRSAVTTCLLRSCGVPAQMVMGAQTFPFKAHAWTEVAGRAINEPRNVQSTYGVWERC
jgi:hypothetical protein